MRPSTVDGPTSLRELAQVFLRISLLGFGGPNAHIALMLDEVVERRRWMTRERFLELVAVTNLLPGPNSSEVAIHIGHVRRGVRGGLVSGLAFTLPTFVIVVVLSALYFRFGTMPALGAVFAGLAPMIVAIILVAGWKLARTAATEPVTIALAGFGALVALLASGYEFAAMVAGGLATWWMHAAPRFRASALLVAPLLGPSAWPEAGRLLWVSLWIGSVLFGGGYMLIALLEPIAVTQHAWVTSREFLDGVALTQAVPGPIVMLVAFIGFAVAGVWGAALAAFGLYLPSFVAVFAAAPLLARWRAHETVRVVLRGVTAVACGAIIGAGLRMGTVAVQDPVGIVLLVTGLALQLRWSLSPPWLIMAGLVAGVARYLVGTG